MCDEGFVWNGKECVCPTRTALNEFGICLPLHCGKDQYLIDDYFDDSCADCGQNCAECADGTGDCEVCKSNYIKNADHKTCGCAAGFQDDGFACVEPVHECETGKYWDGNACSKCKYDCADCISEFQCTKCNDESFLLKDGLCVCDLDKHWHNVDGKC